MVKFKGLKKKAVAWFIFLGSAASYFSRRASYETVLPGIPN